MGSITDSDPAWELNVQRGFVPGHRVTLFVGVAEGVSAVERDVWPLQSYRVWPTSAATLSLVSSSADDAAAGTGARSVAVFGLNADYVEISEVVALNGVTPVSTVTAFLRVQTVTSVSVGSTGSNVGTITISHSGNGQQVMTPTTNLARCMAMTVPARHTGFIMDALVTFTTTQLGETRGVAIQSHLRSPTGIVTKATRTFYEVSHQSRFGFIGAMRAGTDLWFSTRMHSQGGSETASVAGLVTVAIVHNDYVAKAVSGE